MFFVVMCVFFFISWLSLLFIRIVNLLGKESRFYKKERYMNVSFFNIDQSHREPTGIERKKDRESKEFCTLTLRYREPSQSPIEEDEEAKNVG